MIQTLQLPLVVGLAWIILCGVDLSYSAPTTATAPPCTCVSRSQEETKYEPDSRTNDRHHKDKGSDREDSGERHGPPGRDLGGLIPGLGDAFSGGSSRSIPGLDAFTGGGGMGLPGLDGGSGGFGQLFGSMMQPWSAGLGALPGLLGGGGGGGGGGGRRGGYK